MRSATDIEKKHAQSIFHNAIFSKENLLKILKENHEYSNHSNNLSKTTNEEFINVVSWPASQEEFQNWLGNVLPHKPSEKLVKEYWTMLLQSNYSLPLSFKFNGEFTGYAELNFNNHTFGGCRLEKFIIGPQSNRNKGHGSKFLKELERFVFDLLCLHRFDLFVVERNFVAKNLYIKQGFQSEGVMRESRYYDNTFFDIEIMAKLKASNT